MNAKTLLLLMILAGVYTQSENEIMNEPIEEVIEYAPIKSN